MSKLFGRVAKVVITRRPQGFVGSNQNFFEQLGNAVEIVSGDPTKGGLRIRFNVTKNLGKDPNKCEVKVDNLSPNERSQIEGARGPVNISLYAGYQSTFKLLFTGDMTRGYSQREGRTNIVTTMTVGDGMRAFASSHTSRSYKPNTKVRRILQDAASSMGLKLPAELDKATELDQALPNGFSANEPTREVLTKMLAPYGYGWSIQNGQLQIISVLKAREGIEFVVDAGAGLLNANRTYPEKPGGKSEVKFQTLLYPELVPGARAHLTSEFLNTSMKMTDVQHSGDSAGSDWYTSVSGKPL